MKSILISLLIIMATGLSGQQVIFYRTFPKPDWDYADAVIERSDGNYLLAGSSTSQHGTDYDISLILVDYQGNTIWDKYLGLADSMEFAYSLIEMSDGNYLAGGRIGMYYPYLCLFNVSGELIRDMRFPEVDQSYGAYSVGETAGNNYYFIQPGPVTTFYLVNPAGEIISAKTYDFAYCNAVIQTSDMGFMLVGHTQGQYGYVNNVMVRTDDEGDTLWTKTVNKEGYLDGISLLQLEDDGYIVAGSYDDPIMSDEPEATFLARTDNNGDTLWTHQYWIGTPVCIRECRFHSGYILSSKMYFSPGGIYPDEYYLNITRFDTSGIILWSRQFDGYTSSIGNNVTQTSDGGFLLTGHITGNPSATDAVLIKLDSLGDFVLSTKEIDFQSPSGVFAYPNPATEYISFRLMDQNIKIDNARIFDNSGLELSIKHVYSGNEVKVELAGFRPGIYYYMLSAGNGMIFKGKFLVA